MAKVGGGFLSMEDFIASYTDTELDKADGKRAPLRENSMRISA